MLGKTSQFCGFEDPKICDVFALWVPKFCGVACIKRGYKFREVTDLMDMKDDDHVGSGDWESET